MARGETQPVSSDAEPGRSWPDRPAKRVIPISGTSRLALLLTLAGFVVAFGLASRSDGFYHDDDITHFLFARDAWANPGAMWHWWSRPGYNVPTMFVARFFGVFGCRVFSALQTAAVAFVAYLIARRLGRAVGLPDYAAALAPALVWVQPMLMTLAYTTLTETPAALYLTLAVWLYLRGNRVWACAVLSPMFITRYETMALAPILAGAVIYDALRARTWRIGRAVLTPWAWACVAAMLWAPAAQVVASIIAKLPPGDSILHMFGRQYSPGYGRGAWNHFLIRWVLAAGGGTLALAAAGAVRLGRRGWLVTALTGGLVVVHTLLYRYGLFGSGGYERFLVPVAGLVGALAATGLGAAWHRARQRGPEAMLLVLAAALFAVLHYAPYLTQHAPWLWPFLSMKRIVPLAALLLLAGCAMAVTRQARWRSVLGRSASVVALGIIVVQAAVMVRPLTMASSPLNTAVTRCVREVALGPYGGKAALTTHVLVRLLRDRVDLVQDAADAEEQWKRVRPGTLFYWDSKYGGDVTGTKSAAPLYRALGRRGRLLSIHRVDSYAAAVFRRLPDPPPATGPRADSPAGE